MKKSYHHFDNDPFANIQAPFASPFASIHQLIREENDRLALIDSRRTRILTTVIGFAAGLVIGVLLKVFL
jgi:hypothetical protein